MTKSERAERKADALRLRAIGDELEARANELRALRWEAAAIAARYGETIPSDADAAEREEASARAYKTEARELRLLAFAVEKGGER